LTSLKTFCNLFKKPRSLSLSLFASTIIIIFHEKSILPWIFQEEKIFSEEFFSIFKSRRWNPDGGFLVPEFFPWVTSCIVHLFTSLWTNVITGSECVAWIVFIFTDPFASCLLKPKGSSYQFQTPADPNPTHTYYIYMCNAFVCESLGTWI